MQTRHRVTKAARASRRVFKSLRPRAGFTASLVAASLLAAVPVHARAQNQTQTPPPSTTRQPAPPAGTTP
ncbi:MAG TPA: hypothetical protein VF570_18120, partial [Pyrinomonadaceae bacterium]